MFGFGDKGLSLRDSLYKKWREDEAKQRQTAAVAITPPPSAYRGVEPQEGEKKVNGFTFFSKDELVREFMRLSIKMDGLRTTARFVEGGEEAFNEVAAQRQAVIDALAARGIDVSALV
jgi:hypothetical protein